MKSQASSQAEVFYSNSNFKCVDAVRGESLIVFCTSFCTTLFSTTCTAREGLGEWHAPAPTGAEKMS